MEEQCKIQYGRLIFPVTEQINKNNIFLEYNGKQYATAKSLIEIIYKKFLKQDNLFKTMKRSVTYAKYLSVRLEGYNINHRKSKVTH